MNKSNNNEPIFVVGMPRSGTTLMRYCLNQHSHIYIVPETNFFETVYGNRQIIPEAKISENIDKLLSKLMGFTYQDADMHLLKEFFPLKDVLAQEIKDKAQNYRDIATIVFSKFAKEKGKQRWGEKTPRHLFFIDQIYDFFPNAKIITMERSAKNTIASNFKSNHIKTGFLDNCVLYKKCLDYARKYQDKILIVKYEDLTRNPESTMKKVCEYIGEEFEPQMLNPGMIDSSYNSENIIHDRQLAIQPDDENKWKKALDDYQSQFINYTVLQEKNTSSDIDRLQFYQDVLKMKAKQVYFEIQLTKNRLGYENVKRILANDWT